MRAHRWRTGGQTTTLFLFFVPPPLPLPRPSLLMTGHLTSMFPICAPVFPPRYESLADGKEMAAVRGLTIATIIQREKSSFAKFCGQCRSPSLAIALPSF